MLSCLVLAPCSSTRGYCLSRVLQQGFQILRRPVEPRHAVVEKAGEDVLAKERVGARPPLPVTIAAPIIGIVAAAQGRVVTGVS